MVRFPVEERAPSFICNIQTGSGSHPDAYWLNRGDVKMIGHFNLVSRLRIHSPYACTAYTEYLYLNTIPSSTQVFKHDFSLRSVTLYTIFTFYLSVLSISPTSYISIYSPQLSEAYPYFVSSPCSCSNIHKMCTKFWQCLYIYEIIFTRITEAQVWHA